MINNVINLNDSNIDVEKQKKHWGWICRMNQSTFISPKAKYTMIKMLINEAFRHARSKVGIGDQDDLKAKYIKLKSFIDEDIINDAQPTEILCKLSKLRLFTDLLIPDEYNSQYVPPTNNISPQTINFLQECNKKIKQKEHESDSEVET